MLTLPIQIERVVEAERHYRRCLLCEHRCGVNRLAGERGPCKAGAVPRVYRHRVEYGEELELIPSLLFYLSGCDLRCIFCVGELNAFDPSRGRELTAELFRAGLEQGRAQGARTLQWVGGEPTIHLPAILRVMSEVRPELPIVWKSDFHGTVEAMALLDGVADVYLADFKFGNDACAKRLAGIASYVAVVTRNLRLAARQGRLIVRHLLMPGHFDCCYRPIVQWLREHLPNVPLSLRDSYLPRWRAGKFGEMGQTLDPGTGKRARDLALEAGLEVIQ